MAHEQYTFTFDAQDETRFRNTLARLEDDEYSVLEPIVKVDESKGRYSQLRTVMMMDPEAALTFRMSMKVLKIERKLDEAEQEEREKIKEHHKVKITIHTGEPPKV